MILPLLAVIQTVAPLEATPPARRAGVDLPAAWHPAGGCPASSEDGEIVVCGQRDAGEKYRARPLPEKYAEVGGPGIGVDLGKGARGNLYVAQHGSADGKPDKRIMVTVTMPF